MIKLSFNSLNLARCLIIALAIAVMISPAITNLIELILLITCIASRPLRHRIIQAARQPMVASSLIFYLIVTIGIFYSIASHKETISMWFGWRKLLLLPIAAAIFDTELWKLRFVVAILIATTILCLLSYLGAIAHIYFPVPEHEFGIVIRNHATQGVIFGMAGFSAAVLAIVKLCKPLPIISMKGRWCFGLVGVLFIFNIAFITIGRSGYVVLIVCSICVVAGLLLSKKGLQIKHAILGLASIALIGSTLALAPSSSQRIKQAINEASNFQHATTITSMGIRMYFWQNTLEIMMKKPWEGYGTGAFETAYSQEVANKSGLSATITSDPHNQFMKIAVEHGFIGLAAFLAFLICACIQKAGSPYRMLGIGLMVAWVATSLANSHFSTFSEGTFIYLWMGAMLAERSRNLD